MMIQNNLAFTEDQAIPEGYKKTDQGLLPQSWNIVAIRTLVSRLDAGISVNSVDSLDAYSHGKHVLKTSCVTRGYFLPNEKKSILPIDINRAKTIPEKGSIIVSRMNTPELVGELGYVNVFDENIYLPDRLWQMIFKKDQQLCSRWLAYLLSSKKFSKQIKESATGTSNSMKNISKEVLLSLEIPYPKFDEQQKIATALSDTDALISELEKLIEKKQAIKTATMQQLLTGKTRLPEFALHEDSTPKGYKDSELGQIPEDWMALSIGSDTSLKARIGWQALTTAEYLKEGNYYLVTGTDFNGGLVNWNSCCYVSEWRYKQDKNIQLQEHDVLVTKDGTIGKVGFIESLPLPATLNSGVFVVRPKLTKCLPRFLFYILTSSYFDDFVKLITAGSTIVHLYQKDFVNFKFYVPHNIEEQSAIANILADLDAELAKLNLKLDKFKNIKQGMMQELLTGKTRLV